MKNSEIFISFNRTDHLKGHHNSLLRGGVKAKTTKPIVSQQIFIWKALSQKCKVGGGGGGGAKNIHFLKALFKT